MRLWKGSRMHFIGDHARRMFRVSEMTGTSSIICHFFQHC
jgi:hypothetical protein